MFQETILIVKPSVDPIVDALIKIKSKYPNKPLLFIDTKLIDESDKAFWVQISYDENDVEEF